MAVMRTIANQPCQAPIFQVDDIHALDRSPRTCGNGAMTGDLEMSGLILSGSVMVRAVAILLREFYAGRAALVWAQRRSASGEGDECGDVQVM